MTRRMGRAYPHPSDIVFPAGYAEAGAFRTPIAGMYEMLMQSNVPALRTVGEYLGKIDPLYQVQNYLLPHQQPQAPPAAAAQQNQAVKEMRDGAAGDGRVPLGLGSAQLTGTATASGLGAVAQKEMLTDRLLLLERDLVATAGAAPGTTLVTNINVGVDRQQAGVVGSPIEAFGADGTGIRLEGSFIGRGITVTVDLQRTVAPGAGETVEYSGTLFGRINL